MRKLTSVIIDSFLLITFFSLAYLFMVQSQLNPTKPYTNLPTTLQKNPQKQTFSTINNYLDERITWIKDQRSSECVKKSYSTIDDIKYVIVLDFYDYQFYALKVTIASILEHTDHLKEIIIVDDGTSMDHILQEVKEYVQHLPHVNLMRSDTRRGQGHSRNMATSATDAEFMVFVDSNTVVSQGWLLPLLEYLRMHGDAIVQPSFDLLHDSVSYEYLQASPGVNTHVTFDWQFALRVSETPTKERSLFYFKTPAIRGNVLAITKKNYQKLGGYDLMFESGGGENLELSLRANIKCTDIIVSKCSRVGVINRNNPILTRDSRNKKRIMHLWMEESFQSKLQQFSGIDNKIGELDRASIRERKLSLTSNNCGDRSEKSFEDFVKGVQRELLYKLPHKRPTAFGYMKVKSGHCAFISDNDRFALCPCPKSVLPIQIDKFFTYVDNLIKVKNKCLQYMTSMYIELKDCDKENKEQQWSLTDDRFTNKASGLCMMHVTDPNKSLQPTQILMAQDCNHYSKEEKRFSTFEFRNV